MMTNDVLSGWGALLRQAGEAFLHAIDTGEIMLEVVSAALLALTDAEASRDKLFASFRPA